ncbi:MAG: hypothetical protein ACSHUF_00175 [Candidatus Nasuia deltocephalinicola]
MLWIKPWIYSKISIVVTIIWIIKKNKIKNKIINIITESKNSFFFNYITIIKNIKNIIIINFRKIKNIKSKNILKIKIIETVAKNNVIEYKVKMNNKIKKIENIWKLLERKFLIKKGFKILIIIIILININYSNLIINNNKKLNMKYKICGKNLKKINIIKIQQIEGYMMWIIKTLSYLIEIIIINN